MGALAKAAENVNKAWCKNDLRAEKEARDKGDSYCAVGALAVALLPAGHMLSLDGEAYGPADLVYELDKIEMKTIADPEYVYTEEDYNAMEHIYSQMTGNTYEFTGLTDEVQALAEVIRANYADRVNEIEPKDYADDEVFNFFNATVYTFNDHDDTTREEVVAMMEKADILLADRALADAAAEDKSTDDLVAEIDELVNV